MITGVSVQFTVSVGKRIWAKLLRSRSSSSSSAAAAAPAAAAPAAAAAGAEDMQLPCEALNPLSIWEVAEKIEVLVKRILTAYRHRWMQEELADLLHAPLLPPPPIFIKCLGVERSKESASSIEVKFAERPDNIILQPEDLGTPILPYATPLGAVLLSRVLGMVDDADLMDFAVLVCTFCCCCCCCCACCCCCCCCGGGVVAHAAVVVVVVVLLLLLLLLMLLLLPAAATAARSVSR